MKIAVASTNGKNVDLHFGDANRFLIYKIIDGEGKFHEIRERTEIPLKSHGERWIASMDIVEDCKAVLCSKIGKKPMVELRKLGIKPIQLDCGVKDAIEECSKHLLG